MNFNQTVWIARHGNRLDFVNPEWFNTAEHPYDPPLSEDGLMQARQLGKRLKSENIVHIFTSPFLRTIQTAHQVAEILDLEIKLEAGLAEWHNPEWMKEHPAIHHPDYLKKKYPRINWHYSSKVIPQYPETKVKVMQRTGEVVKQLTAELSEDILLVGHRISVLGTTWGLVGETPEINAALCCLVKVVYKDDRWQLKLNGDTFHVSKI